ncbi:MAG: helix-turn-helix transcriptional regulator [Armatimonadetes bacterium]|nr:helix-turn-helix transcriptional regulator [Armatimonadota bacterium]
MKKTNFESYLAEQMKDPEFAARFERANEDWDIALQLTTLRQQAGLSQKELARRVGTSQQQISRLESANYEGHSLSTLRRIAQVLDAKVRVVFDTEDTRSGMSVAESRVTYRARRGGKEKAL